MREHKTLKGDLLWFEVCVARIGDLQLCQDSKAYNPSQSRKDDTPPNEIRAEDIQRREKAKIEREIKDKTHIWLLKSFIISKKWLYTFGLSWNCTQVVQRVRHIQWPVIGVAVALSRVGSRDGGISIVSTGMSSGLVDVGQERGWRGLSAEAVLDSHRR